MNTSAVLLYKQLHASTKDRWRTVIGASTAPGRIYRRQVFRLPMPNPGTPDPTGIIHGTQEVPEMILREEAFGIDGSEFPFATEEEAQATSVAMSQLT